MKIAIANPHNFSNAAVWKEYAKKKGIECIEVNPYDNDIVDQVRDCDYFFWHHSQTSYKDLILAKPLLFSLQCAGVKVYPNFDSGWHFDDKLGQKYFLEAAGAPLVKSYAFYSEEEALEWAKQTEYPKVFKLRGGAAAKNVKLVHDFKETQKLIRQAFHRGFPYFDAVGELKETYSKFKRHKASIKNLLGAFFRLFKHSHKNDLYHSEKGYVYFQDFMPGNTYDTRIVVIGGKYAVAERRMTRKNDFRASGSGDFSYEGIDENIVKIAIETAKKLKMQSVAYDFVYDADHNPKIVEICFGFGTKGISHAPYFWDDKMVKHENEPFDISTWIIDSVING